MRIYATFVNFKYDPEVIELVHAWDEYSCDDNAEGYQASLERELASYDDEILNKIAVTLEVDEVPIRKLLSGRAPVLPAKVIPR